MARYKIYSSDGTKVRYEGSPIYNGTYLKASYLEFREICSPVPIEWEVGDYVVYDRTGLTYRLYSIPQPKKSARRESFGGAFTYQNVQFHSAEKQLEIAPFRDLVSADNSIHFSTLPDVNTYENVEGIARRIQASLDQMYPGSWAVSVNLNLSTELLESVREAREFAVSNGSCMNALEQIYSVWDDIGWTYSYDATSSKNILTIAGANSRTATNTTSEFQYGRGKGLTSLKKVAGNNDELATRLYVYGNTTNMISRYYNGKDIVDKDSVNIQHLMIPVSSWGKTDGVPDARKSFIQASDAVVSKFGLIPRNVYFDGSEYDDIHPSIAKVTIGEVKGVKDDIGDTAFYPSSAYRDDERVDEVKGVTNPEDDGLVGNEGKSFLSRVEKKFVVGKPCSEATNNEGVWTLEGEITSASLPDVNYTKTLSFLSTYTVTLIGTDYLIPEVKIIIKAGNEELKSVRYSLVKMGENSVQYLWNIPDIKLTTDLPTNDIRVLYKVTYKHRNESTPTDVGTLTILGGLTIMQTYKLPSDFSLVLKQIGFNISERMSFTSEGKCTVSFKDGMCAGRSFAVRSVEYRSETDDWLLRMYRNDDNSLGMRFPNSTYPVREGDHFVLLDLAMPELYITTAERRLLAAGQRLLADVARVKPNYEPEIDAKVMVLNNWVIREGMYMHITDADVVDGGSAYVLIDTLTINEGESNIPTYKVSLREQKSYSYRQSISTSSGSATQSGGGTTEELRMYKQSVAVEDIVMDEGTKDYNDLENIPIVDGVALKGSKASYSDLGLINRNQFELVNVGSTTSPKMALKAKYPFFSNDDVAAYGIGTEGVSSGRSLGTLPNVSVDADQITDVNKILVRYSNDDDWRPVSFNDMFATGTLTSASLSSTDGQGNTGTFLKMVFNTGDTVYADLSAMTDSTMSRLFSKIEELENMVVCDSESNILAMYNSGTLDPDKVYYGYEE